MKRSSLNSHLFRKNIVVSPTCDCDGFASPYHLFFICPRYIGIRNTYPSNILQTHRTKELLFGKETASVNENETLLLKVQDYIIKSRRFICFIMHVILHLSLNMKLICKTMSEIEITFMIMQVKITCISWKSVSFLIFFLGISWF